MRGQYLHHVHLSVGRVCVSLHAHLVVTVCVILSDKLLTVIGYREQKQKLGAAVRSNGFAQNHVIKIWFFHRQLSVKWCK